MTTYPLSNKKCKKNIGILYRIRHNLSPSILTLLYQTLVHPYLEYCNIVWAIHHGSALNDLYICQKKAIRTVTFSNRLTHTKPIFKKLSILTVFDINKQQTAIFMYKCINNLLPTKFFNLFDRNSNIHDHSTRQCDDIHILRHSLNIRRYSVKIFGPKLWNSIPPTIRLSPTLNSFKVSYKKLLLHNAFVD